jgi:Zn-dependent protease
VGKWLLPAIKFGLPLVKMGGFMFLSLFLYSRLFGWPFAAGIILLIFVHEMGHLIAARAVGLKVSLPLFIPFMGAMIAMREMPPNAWTESIIGIGGPLLGSLGSLLVASCYFLTGNQIFLILGYFGCFINLFNLVPIVPLDGGRIV